MEVIARSQEGEGGAGEEVDDTLARQGRLARLRQRGGGLLDRADPGSRGLRTILVVLACAAALTVLVIWLQRPSSAELPDPGGAAPISVEDEPETVPGPAVDEPSQDGTALSQAPDASGVIVVAVVGRVAEPGVVEVREGSRVADALREAGGTLGDADLTSVNLAQRLQDGEQLVVAALGPDGQPQAGSAGLGASSGASGTVPGSDGARGDAAVDLNAATFEELDRLPGVGPVLAERIMRWRESNGGFDSVEQLREVEGIGAARFSDLQTRVTV